MVWFGLSLIRFAAERVAITGMNDLELRANRQATDYSLKDLNRVRGTPFFTSPNFLKVGKFLF